MNRSVRTFKSVGTVMSFGILSFIFAALLQAVLAYLYGAGDRMDAYFLALSFPLLISGIFISTLAVIFIPVFKEFMVKDDPAGLWGFVNALNTCLVLILGALTAVLYFFAPFIVSCIPDSMHLAQRALAVSLLRILSFSIIPAGLYSLYIIVYYSKEAFTKPVLVRSLNPLVVIAFVVLSHKFLGIKSAAYGFVLACTAQFLSLFYYLQKEDPEFKVYFKWVDKRVTALWKVALLVVFGQFIYGLILPAEKLFAANLSGGSVSYLGYVERIFSILILLPNMAIPTVILPQLAEHFAARDISQLRRSFSMGVRSALFITAPLVAVLFIFRQPLIYLFLQRGAFDIQATACTALALTGYLGVFFESERLVILNTFYAMRDVITPLVTGSITFLLYILMAVPLSARFSFFGLGLAHSLACLAFSGINLVLLQRKLGGIEAKRIGACLSRVAIASFGAGLLMAGIYYSGRQCVTPRSFSSGILRLSFTFLSGAIAYLFFCWLLRLEELKQFYNTLVTYKQGILMKGQRSIKE